MPLPIAHGLLGASIVAALYPQFSQHPQPARRCFTPLFIGGVLANLPDFDFLLVFAFHSRAWHRGFSHSILFASFVFLLLLLFLGKRRIKEAFAYGLAFASHGVLDYLTTEEGGGVALLFPFSTDRLAFGWHGLSELPSRFPAIEILKALGWEIILFTPLLIAVVALRKRLAKVSAFAASAKVKT